MMLTIMADTPMVGAMAGMIANAGLMGGGVGAMLALLETMDLRALGDFGR